MKFDLIDELKWRDMVQDMTPGTEEQLEEITVGYIGFDPTADSLGVGNLVQLMTLAHFQNAGHIPVILIGGATGLIGDPSGRLGERQLLTEDEVNHNIECQTKQMKKFLDFDLKRSNRATIINNMDWFSGAGLISFARDVGKHITVSYMMSKDSVKNRLNGGISFTEFMYQLMQGYDFYRLWKNNNVMLQMGGSDQWGNIITGIDLIRKKNGGEAFAFTTPLVTKKDGTKFGKSASGNIWLDPNKTSPFKFYQFWLNTTDEDARRYLRIFTMMSRQEIFELEEKHRNEPSKRYMQKALAEDLTVRVHSSNDYLHVLHTTYLLYHSESMESILDIDFEDAFSENETIRFNRSVLENETIPSAFLGEHAKVYTSKSEALRSLKDGAVSINKTRVDCETRINKTWLIHDKYILVQKGKKNYYLLIAE